MRKASLVKFFAILSAALAGVWAGGAGASAADKNAAIATAITKPSENLKLAFAAPGVVKTVDVKEGDVVKAGQVLVHLDDRMDEKLLQSMKMEGDSVLKVEYAKADMALKRVQLKRKEQMREDNVASESEVEEARLAVTLAETQVALAELEHQQKKLDAERQAVKLEWMHLASPIDGRVEKLDIGLGETADPSKPAVMVVKNDPLWVEAHLPTNQAAQLKAGDSLDVRYNETDKWTPARIIFISGADAQSATQVVRMELANPSGQAPGLWMQVNLPDRVAQANNR